MTQSNSDAAGQNDVVRLRRTAKGKRPQYFHDPAVDKIHQMVLVLIEELSVTRDRLDAVERILEQRNVMTAREVDAYIPDELAESERAARRREYIRRVTKIFTDELAQLSGRDPSLDFDDVVKIVSE